MSVNNNVMFCFNVLHSYFLFSTSIHRTEMIENYNPLINIWYSAERAHSIHIYVPVNITLGIEDRPFISYNTPEGTNKFNFNIFKNKIHNTLWLKCNLFL